MTLRAMCVRPEAAAAGGGGMSGAPGRGVVENKHLTDV